VLLRSIHSRLGAVCTDHIDTPSFD